MTKTCYWMHGVNIVWHPHVVHCDNDELIVKDLWWGCRVRVTHSAGQMSCYTTRMNSQTHLPLCIQPSVALKNSNPTHFPDTFPKILKQNYRKRQKSRKWAFLNARIFSFSQEADFWSPTVQLSTHKDQLHRIYIHTHTHTEEAFLTKCCVLAWTWRNN